jgi:hypothetical protein
MDEAKRKAVEKLAGTDATRKKQVQKQQKRETAGCAPCRKLLI